MADAEERSLIMKDGTILTDSQCGYADHTLWCYVKGLTMSEAFAMFSDPEKTGKIIFRYSYGVEEVYEGFTEMISINKREFTIDICLVKGTEEVTT